MESHARGKKLVAAKTIDPHTGVRHIYAPHRTATHKFLVILLSCQGSVGSGFVNRLKISPFGPMNENGTRNSIS